jgi:hypothetical protein
LLSHFTEAEPHGLPEDRGEPRIVQAGGTSSQTDEAPDSAHAGVSRRRAEVSGLARASTRHHGPSYLDDPSDNNGDHVP